MSKASITSLDSKWLGGLHLMYIHGENTSMDQYDKGQLSREFRQVALTKRLEIGQHHWSKNHVSLLSTITVFDPSLIEQSSQEEEKDKPLITDISTYQLWLVTSTSYPGCWRQQDKASFCYDTDVILACPKYIAHWQSRHSGWKLTPFDYRFIQTASSAEMSQLIDTHELSILKHEDEIKSHRRIITLLRHFI